MNILFRYAAVVTLTVSTFSANAALVARLGGQAYYDTVANLTWLADANNAGTTMNWIDANAWAGRLNVNGVSNWRLPKTLQPDLSCSNNDISGSTEFNCVGSELGNMFYNVLGGIQSESIATTHNANFNLFSNLQESIYSNSLHYWSSTEYALDIGMAWGLRLDLGYQTAFHKSTNIYAWAVHDGDVDDTLVPVPAAAWLLGSGLLGLIGFAKRKKAA